MVVPRAAGCRCPVVGSAGRGACSALPCLALPQPLAVVAAWAVTAAAVAGFAWAAAAWAEAVVDWPWVPPHLFPWLTSHYALGHPGLGWVCAVRGLLQGASHCLAGAERRSLWQLLLAPLLQEALAPLPGVSTGMLPLAG